MSPYCLVPVPYGVCSGGVICLTCDSGLYCPPGYICEHSICERLCDSEDDCGSNQKCALGICTSQCPVRNIKFITKNINNLACAQLYKRSTKY